jgi:hypothetical protein
MIADLIPAILATRMEPRRQNQSTGERLAKFREHNKARKQWRQKRRAQGLPVT